jgi:GPH family glycoside/pentoside/hexuronide:cation symporter
MPEENPADSPAPATPADPKPAAPAATGDASRKEVVLYAVGNIEGGIANQFYNVLNTFTVVALAMNPLVIGLIMSLKTVWDAITDPIMAQITDHARTRWGRRIPFILAGGVARVLFLVAIFVFFPRDPSIKTNAEFQAENAAAEAAKGTAATSTAAQGGTAKPAAPGAGKADPAPPAPQKPKPGLWEQIAAGTRAFIESDSAYHRQVTIYLLAACLIFTLLSTIQSVPYYALGIELCPSYDGRTRVVVARAYVDKLMSFVAPWVMPFVFLPMFATAVDGLVWYAVIVCVIGIPTTVAMCMGIKERGYDPGAKRPPAPHLFRSMWLTAKNPHFLKILFLYVFIGFCNGVFGQVVNFLVIFWVFKGDVVGGGVMGGYGAMIAAVLTFATLPTIKWACERFGKHRALRWAIVWFAAGTILKWFLLNPDHPWLFLLTPFFFSVGIAAVYTILPSLMADVTDVDELNTGVRREGMFGAVMAFLSKALGSLQPTVAAIVLLASGFDAALGANQPPEVFHQMRVLASVIPGCLLFLALCVLFRYPLTRERMEEIKLTLASRRDAGRAEAAP